MKARATLVNAIKRPSAVGQTHARTWAGRREPRDDNKFEDKAGSSRRTRNRSGRSGPPNPNGRSPASPPNPPPSFIGSPARRLSSFKTRKNSPKWNQNIQRKRGEKNDSRGQWGGSHSDKNVYERDCVFTIQGSSTPADPRQ